MADPVISSKEDLVDELMSFTEAAIHNILYIREVYPPNLFSKARIYNVPVWKARHPQLTGYIRTVIEAIRPLYLKGLIDKLCLVICLADPKRTPIEQYVLTCKILNSADGVNVTRTSLETILRSFLLKINVSDALFRPKDGDRQETSFYLLVHTNDDINDPVDQERLQAGMELPWLSVDGEEGGMFEMAEAVPLKTVTTDVLHLQLHVEERDVVK